MSPAELLWIADVVAGCGDVLEIGTYCGLSTECLLNHVDGMVFSVDPLDRAPPRHPDAVKWIRRLTTAFPEKLVFIPAFSGELIWRRPIDVLFIDGDHDYDAVLIDLERFVPYLLKGGLLILDDWEAVEDSFEDFCKKYRLCHADFVPASSCGKLRAFINGPKTRYSRRSTPCRASY